MRTSSRITLNAITSWGATLTRAAIGLVIVPFLIGVLGRDGYGLCGVVITIVTFAAIADLGLRQALSRQLAEQSALGQPDAFNQLASSALALFLVPAVGLALVAAAAAGWLVGWFNVPPSLAAEGTFLIRVFAPFAIVMAFVTPVYAGCLTSANRFDIVNTIGTAVGIAQGVLLLWVLSVTDWGLHGWAGVMAACQLGNLLALRAAARRQRPELRLSFALVGRESVHSLLSLGGLLYLRQLSDLVGVQSAPFILTVLIAPEAVALYAPALAMTTAFRPLVKAVANQLHPLATAYHATQDQARLTALLIRGTRYTLLLGIPSSVLLTIFAEPLTQLWLEPRLGGDYVITAWVVVGWAVIDLVGYAAGSQWPVQLGSGRIRFVIGVVVVAAVFDVAASIYLVAQTDLGPVGVVLPTVVVALTVFPIMTVHAARVGGVPLGDYLRQAYARPALVLVLVAGLGAGLRYGINPRSLLALLACVLVFGGVWLILAWNVGLGRDDRVSVRDTLVRLAGRFRGREAAP